MTIFSLLFQGFIVLILAISFFIGIVMMINGFWKNPMNKNRILKGFSLFIFPLLIFIYYSIKPSLLYEVTDEENALSFYCENVINVQGIKRNFTNFELEFMIGDSDSNEVVYLEKIN